MIIEWNKVTWYSKLGAVLLFIVVVPVITFVIGKEYQKTIDVLENNDAYHPAMTSRRHHAKGTTPIISITSGVTGTVTMGSACPKSDTSSNSCKTPSLATPLIVKNTSGKTVTHTVSRNDGKFFLLLPPDTYKIGVAAAESFQGTSVTSVTVPAEKIVPAKLSL